MMKCFRATLRECVTVKAYITLIVYFAGLVSEFVLKQNLFFVTRSFYSKRNLNDYHQVLQRTLFS